MAGIKLARRASYTALKDSAIDVSAPSLFENRPASAPSPFPQASKENEMLLPGPADIRNSRRRAGKRSLLSVRLSMLAGVLFGWAFVIWRLAVNLPATEDDIHFPRSLDDLKSQSVLLQTYSAAHFMPVFILFTTVFVFKQTFAVPGSALMNILGGVLYGFWAFPLVSFLTAVGSTFSYLLSQYLLGELVVERFARSNLNYLKRRVEANREKGNLFYYLLFLRLFPFSPNWFLNMASPFVGVPILPFFLSIFFGLIPYNYICVQAAATLSQLNSFADILSVDVVLKLLSISALALIPAVYGQKIAAWTRGRGTGDDGEEVKLQQA
ncbi:hypothetical protein SpCBS45565_g00321 [Spizellomyces sp. 'palustris']|nr:hypothetical protein SpCBS45565_g00321 [Spizellomyces sp. 'palustris']